MFKNASRDNTSCNIATSLQRCALVAPLWVADIARAVGLELSAVSATLPTPLPASGILVCLPGTPLQELPPGWVGVWGCPESLPSGAWIPVPSGAVTTPQVLEKALQAAETWRRERSGFSQKEVDRASALQLVNEIGIALSAERDPARLLELILTRARHLVAADAGSLYLLEEDATGERHLRFALTQNDSIQVPWQEFILPLTSQSMAGAVALGGEVITIEDAYNLPPNSPWQHDQSFDRRFGYRTRSVVNIPLLTREGDMLGVLQLINRKPQAGVPLADSMRATEVVPFSEADIELLRSLASQAAISMENSCLYKDIQHLFEGFVQASVTAIEQRDPTTSGHSFRVADGTLALARRVERLERGRWAGSRFSAEELRELRYAALLHDFGKVGVRENVLTKALKLQPEELSALQARFLLARASRHAERLEFWLYEALRNPSSTQQRLPQLQADLQKELQDFDAMLEVIRTANQPGAMADDIAAALEALRQWEFTDLDGQRYPLLTEREIRTLALNRGNLTVEERVEIEKHVTLSFNFLRTIPWTRDLARVPELAGRHHEKLDGSGYPFGLRAADIPLGTRMITISDIFDALVAHDRPYKQAMPLERALQVLEDEARDGRLDNVLVQLWIDSRAWEDIGKY